MSSNLLTLRTRWLISHGRPEKGLQTLARLHSRGDVNDAWVRAEYDQIQDAVTYERDHEAQSYSELFVHKSSFRRLFLAVSMQASKAARKTSGSISAVRSLTCGICAQET